MTPEAELIERMAAITNIGLLSGKKLYKGQTEGRVTLP